MHLTKGLGERVEVWKSVSNSKPNHAIAGSTNLSYLRPMIGDEILFELFNHRLNQFIWSLFSITSSTESESVQSTLLSLAAVSL